MPRRSPSFNEKTGLSAHTFSYAFLIAKQAGIAWGSETALVVYAESLVQQTHEFPTLIRPEFLAAIEGELVMLTGRGMED